MLDERGGISPFGWVVGCTGRTPAEVERDVADLATWCASAWKRSFPAERGYRVCVERMAVGAPGLHLTVERGDFLGEVTIEIARDRPGGRSASPTSPWIRAFGRARSDSVHRAHQRGERVLRRCREIGWGLGVVAFVALSWLMIGVRNPIYVLGGMLLVVALLLTIMAGNTLGTWAGEQLARSIRERARRDATDHEWLSEDVRRWRSMSRQLQGQRNALLSHRRQPFRSEPRAVAS